MSLNAILFFMPMKTLWLTCGVVWPETIALYCLHCNYINRLCMVYSTANDCFCWLLLQVNDSSKATCLLAIAAGCNWPSSVTETRPAQIKASPHLGSWRTPSNAETSKIIWTLDTSLIFDQSRLINEWTDQTWLNFLLLFSSVIWLD